jgi:5-methylthioadenosine/S-adenosylhomocysteine deaminase
MNPDVKTLTLRDVVLDGRSTSIFIEHGKIAAIDDEPRDADRIIDATGLHAFPALANGHTHCAMTLFRGYGDDMPLMEWLQTRIWPAERALTEQDVYHGTRLALLEGIKGGTTYVNDMYWHRDSVARAVRDMGVRGNLAAVFIDMGDGEMAKAQQEQTEALIETQDAFGPRVELALGPHAVYTTSRASLEWIAEVAEREDLLVHIHLSETGTEVEECVEKHGMRPPALLEKLGLVGRRLIAAHGVWLDDEELAMLANADATIVTNPSSNLKLAVGRIFPYARAKEAGLRVVLGTDGAATNNNLDMIQEMRLVALLQKHNSGDATCLPATEALSLATTQASEAFRLGSGRIGVGEAADLMLVDFSRPVTQPLHDPISNLVYAADAGSVHTTICDGEVLMHNRDIEVADEEEIVAEASRAARELLERVRK